MFGLCACAVSADPVNSMISLDDGTTELAAVVDTTVGGSSLSDGSLELMVHRRCLHDDGRGVEEPLNETMCGCNDIGAAPGDMGAHGHEGDGGCDCEGLTMRGSVYIVLDTIENAHRARRRLVETLNFPPTLGFAKELPKVPMMSAIQGALPPNVKLMTVSNSYQKWNEGRLIFRFAHLYAVDEHPTLSQPVTFSLAAVFSKAGLRISNATETTLTANQPRKAWEAKKKSWSTVEVVDRGVSSSPQVADRQWLDESDAALAITLNAMEVKTYLATLAAAV
jgi:alpha-mannosidase